MNKPFKLDEHPRRPRPLLSEPPAGYFDQLPTRVMARLPRAEQPAITSWSWLLQLPASLRTGLATMLVMGGFAASFWWSNPAHSATTASLDSVPQTQLVNYLLNSGARVESTDLAVLAAAHPELPGTFLHASDEELTDALDAQPADESVYF
ncbi:hypothetical protein Q5H93_13405 [Hymenobacter sp. ASUV-10]|uniref:Ankyrin repeat domain-containing protein n=1 Tax=Hymenobacter aranciens TaxID=3063996 RepID=A0ABT9BBT5_9BACT|nr:hypothetical protein [Hymenobacter sp. ASUV-10]MDO7875735.1 hypothetical protein [Hymenobacter sp. ASUV-10]